LIGAGLGIGFGIFLSRRAAQVQDHSLANAA
jgi:hypothetical protein